MTAESALELRDLERLEGKVFALDDACREAAVALTEIRDRRLYLPAGFASFGAYCNARFAGKRGRVYQLIAAGEVIGDIEAELSTQVDKPAVPLPVNERQTRPLARIKEPSERAKVWTRAVEETGGEQPSPAKVRELAAEAIAKLSPQGRLGMIQEENEANTAAERARLAREHVATLHERLERGNEHARLACKQYAHLPNSEDVVSLISSAIEKAKGLLAELN